MKGNFDDSRGEMGNIRLSIKKSRGNKRQASKQKKRKRPKVDVRLARNDSENSYINDFDRTPKLRLDYFSKFDELFGEVEKEKLELRDMQQDPDDDFNLTLREDPDYQGNPSLEEKDRRTVVSEIFGKDDKDVIGVEYVDGERHEGVPDRRSRDDSVPFKNEKLSKFVKKGKKKRRINSTLSPRNRRGRRQSKKIRKRGSRESIKIRAVINKEITLSPDSELKVRIRRMKNHLYSIDDENTSKHYRDALSADASEITITPNKSKNGKNLNFSVRRTRPINSTQSKLESRANKPVCTTARARNNYSVDRNRSRKMLEYPYPQIELHSGSSLHDLDPASKMFWTSEMDGQEFEYSKIFSTFRESEDKDYYKLDIFPNQADPGNSKTLKKKVMRGSRTKPLDGFGNDGGDDEGFTSLMKKKKRPERKRLSALEKTSIRLMKGLKPVMGQRTMKHITKKNYKKLNDEKIKEWEYGGGKERDIKQRMRRSKEFSNVSHPHFF